MKLKGVLIIVAFAVAGLSRAAAAQTELSSRTFFVNVAPTLKRTSLSSLERVLAFSVPVEVPGACLPAGPYIFRTLGPSIVVLNVTRSKHFATFSTVPTEPLDDTSREILKFELTSEERPPRIVVWYPPWSRGREFIYPRPKRKILEEREERQEESIETGRAGCRPVG